MIQIDFEDNFFGRKAELDLLRKRVADLKEGYRQNIALLGARFVGKTSLLQKFVCDLDDPDVISIYLNCENRDFSFFCTKFIKSLLYNYLKSRSLPLYDDVKVLIEVNRGAIPQTVGAIEQILSLIGRDRTAEAYQGLIYLPEVFNIETGKYCLLIFDEFQNLGDFPFPDAFLELGKKIMMQKKSLYIIASSYEDAAQQILSEKLSLLFGNFENVILLPFDSLTSQTFIDRNLGALKIGLQLKNFLADFTGGYPLYLNLLCQELIHLAALYKQSEVYAPILSQALENSIFHKWGVLSRHFEFVIRDLGQGKDSRAMVLLLMSLANGKHKAKELMDDLNLRQNQLMAKINRLIECDVIEKNGSHYHLKDKLMRYWIKYVYQRWHKAVDVEIGRQRKQCKEEIIRALADFQTNSRKDLAVRITELFYCFDNEAFSINGRKYRLPLFKEIVPVRLRTMSGSTFETVRATCEEGYWLVLLKKEPLTENELGVLLNEVKKMAAKPQRCVVIALSDLDENTKLRALQERMWIWQEGEVNSLMNLYDKSYIVR